MMGSLDHAELARVVDGDIFEEPESGLPRFTDKQGIDGNLFPIGEEDVGKGLFIGFFTLLDKRIIFIFILLIIHDDVSLLSLHH